MFRSRDIERWGSGIKRIHDECTENGIKVEFIRRKTGFVVLFYRPAWIEESVTSEKTAHYYGKGISNASAQPKAAIGKYVNRNPAPSTLMKERLGRLKREVSEK